MKKFIQIFVVILLGFFIGSAGMFIKHSVKTSVAEPVGFVDTSKIVVYKNPGLPTITFENKVSREELMSQARIRYMLKRRAEAKKFVESQEGVGRPVVVKANITVFAGRPDRVVRRNEKGSVSGEILRNTDPNRIYTAWPLPGVNEDNIESPWKLPNVEEHFGRGSGSFKKRIEYANLELANYYAEFTYFCKKTMQSKTVLAEIIDRGPSTRFELPRWDASRGLWRALGLEETLNGSPNRESDQVEFVVRLVPKSTAVFSESGGEKFQLPSWDNETTVASNL
jgi:hypothetical protein